MGRGVFENTAYQFTIRDRDGTERVILGELVTFDPDRWHGEHLVRLLDLPGSPMMFIRARSVVDATPADSVTVARVERARRLLERGDTDAPCATTQDDRADMIRRHPSAIRGLPTEVRRQGD
jgi:hypothetical protein